MKSTIKELANCIRIPAGLAAVTGMFIAISCLNAQEPEDDVIYDMSLFVVEASSLSTGYTTANSSSATSFRLPVRDTPVSMDFVSAELIEDLQADDMKEALEFQAGVFFETNENQSSANEDTSTNDVSPSSNLNVNNPFADTVVIRGYPVPNQQRLGFRVGSIVPAYGVVLGGFTDSSNTERLEVVKGPQSLLYGINVLSGIVNIIPKRPLDAKRTNISASMGSDRYYRGTFEHMAPTGVEGLNYRVVGSLTSNEHWTQYRQDEREYYALQFQWDALDWISVFVEGQYGFARRNGIGNQYFTDTATGLQDSEFKNEYGERYTFGFDFLNTDTFNPDVYNVENTAEILLDEYGNNLYGGTKLTMRPNGDYSNAFVSLGDERRLSGPDTYRTQEEYDILAMVNLKPFRNFEVELGTYYTDVSVDVRNVDMAVVNTTRGTFAGQKVVLNPELSDALTPGGVNNALTGNVQYFGIGEIFRAPNPFAESTSAADSVYEDIKLARYIWYSQPTSSESLQLRLRVGYTFETDILSKAQHVITGGVNYTQDDVSFVSGGVSEAVAYDEDRSDRDPYYLRSIFDYSNIRYNSGPLAIPGSVTYSGLEGVDVEDDIEDYVARSGWREATLWYKGQYLIYYGKFLNERLHFLGGLRRDAYQVKEREYLRAVDLHKITDDYMGGSGSAPPILPALVGFGDTEYIWRDDLPDEINQGISESIHSMREVNPGGTVGYNFDKDQVYTTATYGVSFRVTDALSIYYNHSEGIFPNTGQRDGAYRPIDAEQTRSDEIGGKFELLGGRLSGSLGFFKIKRENAVWRWLYAPNPAAYYNGPNSTTSNPFDPGSVRDDSRSIRYGVVEDHVIEAFSEANIEIPTDRRGNPSIPQLQEQFPELISGTLEWTGNPLDPSSRAFYYFVDYEAIKDTDSPFRKALDAAVRDRDFGGTPIRYFGDIDLSYSASRTVSSPGANVLFEEEGTGFDGSLIFSPFQDNRYQLIFGFAQQEREVVGNGFQLAPTWEVDINGDPVDDPETGEPKTWSTEYDIWVYMLGPDNFEDPRDPRTLKGSAVNGANLSFVPEWNLTFWNKYAFQDGLLKGLSIAGGVRWTSAIPTTAGVGGDDIALNRYPTPDLPARYVADISISYRRIWKDISWSISLKVNNLLDDNEGLSIVTYSDGAGNSIARRTRKIYEPRSTRISVSAGF